MYDAKRTVLLFLMKLFAGAVLVWAIFTLVCHLVNSKESDVEIELLAEGVEAPYLPHSYAQYNAPDTKYACYDGYELYLKDDGSVALYKDGDMVLATSRYTAAFKNRSE